MDDSKNKKIVLQKCLMYKNYTKENLKNNTSLFKSKYKKEGPKEMDLNKKNEGKKEATTGKCLKNQLIYKPDDEP